MIKRCMKFMTTLYSFHFVECNCKFSVESEDNISVPLCVESIIPIVTQAKNSVLEYNFSS